MTNRLNIGRIATVAVTALVIAGGAPVASASTTSGDVSDGTLDWGVKESFRSYIVSPVANGEIEVVDGAAENSDGSFRFAGGSGTVGDGTAELSFSGTVHFTGHDGALDVTISNPGVAIDGANASLIADVSSLGQDGEPAEFPDVVLADLDLSGASVEPDADGVVSVSGIPATLSDAGAPAFGGFYDAGEALDPVSFTVQTSGTDDSDESTDDNGEQSGSDDGDEGGASDDEGGTSDAEGAADDDALPKTGAPWLLVAVGGVILVALGASFVLLGRLRVAGGTHQ